MTKNVILEWFLNDISCIIFTSPKPEIQGPKSDKTSFGSSVFEIDFEVRAW